MTTPIQTTTKTTAAVPCEDCPAPVPAKAKIKCSERITNPDGSVTIFDPIYQVGGHDHYIESSTDGSHGLCAVFGYKVQTNYEEGSVGYRGSYGHVNTVILDFDGSPLRMRRIYNEFATIYDSVTCKNPTTPVAEPAAAAATEPPATP